MTAGRKDAVVPSPNAAYEAIRRALEVRHSLLSDPETTCCRLFNGAADGVTGLVLEKFGEVLIAQLHEGRLKLEESAVRNLCALAMESTGTRSVYQKIFASNRSAALHRVEESHQDPQPWLGTPAIAEFPILENGMTFLIRPFDGFSVGLFPEQRENRVRVRTWARNAAVLNTFAYTCGFSTAAALGGARLVVSVDVSKKYLDWGRRNFEANGLDPQEHVFIRADVFDYFKRAARQGKRFDLIILDPPTFGRGKRPQRVFSLAEDLDRLVQEAVELLHPGGRLLLSVNRRETSFWRLEESLTSANPGDWASIERLQLPMDYRGDPDFAKFLLARLKGKP